MGFELHLFASELAAGLAGALALTPASAVNPGYFRTCLLVVLGLTVLAGLTGGTAAGPFILLFGMGALSYAGYLAWSLGQARAGSVCLLLLAAVSVGLLALESGDPTSGPPALALANAVSGALVAGSSLAAMLLGHYYLTAPWMTLVPLRRQLGLLVVACVLRGLVSGLAVAHWWHSVPSEAGGPLRGTDLVFYVGLRWVVGILGPFALALMVWQTLKLKATQAATGILYVLVIFAWIGEATALAIRRFAEGLL